MKVFSMGESMRVSDSELLSSFVDGELNLSELKRVNEILNRSQEWRDELERLRAAKMLLSKAGRFKAPADLLDSIRANAAPPPPEKKIEGISSLIATLPLIN